MKVVKMNKIYLKKRERNKTSKHPKYFSGTFTTHANSYTICVPTQQYLYNLIDSQSSPPPSKKSSKLPNESIVPSFPNIGIYASLPYPPKTSKASVSIEKNCTSRI